MWCEAFGKSQWRIGMMTEAVLSLVKALVEKHEISAAHRSAGHHSPNQLFFQVSRETGGFARGAFVPAEPNYSSR